MKKRVLIVSHNSLSLHANNGKTLTNLFSTYEPSDIAQLYFQDEIPESIKFTNFYRLRDIDQLFNFITFSSRYGGQVSPKDNLVVGSHKKKPIINKLINILRKTNIIKRLVRDFLYSRNICSNKKLMNWVGSFQPDVIFLVSGDYKFSVDIAISLSKNLSIPLDIYTTDDYVVEPRYTNFISSLVHQRLVKTYKKANLCCRNWFTIGHDMSKIFSVFFHRKFYVVMNCVSVESFPTFDRPCSGHEYYFIYAGGLHLGRLEAINYLSKIFESYNAVQQKKIKLKVFTNTSLTLQQRKSINKSIVTLMPPLDFIELANEIRTANFILFVESIDPYYSNITKLSVSTKIPESLASGVPIVAYGPSTQSSIRLLKENGLALVFDENSSEFNIMNDVIKFVNDSPMQSAMIEKAHNYAKRNFDIHAVSCYFSSIINRD